LTVESLAYATLQGGTEFGSWLSNREERVPQTPEDDNVVLLERAGPRLTITLNSPDNRNALSVPMRDALTSAFKLVAMDNSIERVDVHGNGPCFSAGGDLTEFGTLANPTDAHVIRLTRMPARYLEPCAGRYTFHLHAACIGAGIELPAFAGRLVATSDTIFQLPEVAMGLIPGAGGCVSIPRRIGRQRTAYMAILGERFSATDTLAWGLIDAIED
jgi:enoyl-CoA hydratase/carnithine racemase